MIIFGLFIAVFTLTQGVPSNAQNPYVVYPANINNNNNVPGHCPLVNCPQWCSRFIGQNGCTYCGPCNQKQPICPPVKCPNRPNVKCAVVKNRNGCKQCVCQQQQQVQQSHRVLPMYNSAPNAPNAPNCPTPQCSSNCQLVFDQRGCGHCRCFPPVCPPFSCPVNCNKYQGVDGCQQCDCGEVASCPLVPCDLNRCRHLVDGVSGCAVSCECNNIPLVTQPGHGK